MAFECGRQVVTSLNTLVQRILKEGNVVNLTWLEVTMYALVYSKRNKFTCVINHQLLESKLLRQSAYGIPHRKPRYV